MTTAAYILIVFCVLIGVYLIYRMVRIHSQLRAQVKRLDAMLARQDARIASQKTAKDD